MPKEMLAPNQRVTLHSLKSSPSLNGKHGTIIGALLESGRYPVQCGKERLALWPANLSLLAEPPAATILPELKLEPRWSPPASHGWKKAITPKPFDNELHALLEMLDDGVAIALDQIDDPPLRASLQSALDALGVPHDGGIYEKPDEWEYSLADKHAESSSSNAASTDEDDELVADAAVLDAAFRGAAFVQQDAASASFSPLPASAWRDDDNNAASSASNNNNKGKMRFHTELCGGTVRVIDVSTPHGIEAARKYIAKRLPVIMRGSSDDGGASWPLLGPTLKKELSSASAIGEHLMGKQVTVLHAPQQASQRFTYYFSENAEEEDGDNNDMAAAPPPPPPVNRHLRLVWGKELVRKLQGEGGRDAADDGNFYMQLTLASRSGSGAAAIGANGASPLPMEGAFSSSSASDDRLLKELETAVRSKERMGLLTRELGPWQSSMLYVGPVGTLAPCHWDALDNCFTQLAGTKQVLLFAPDQSGLRQFPTKHPFDSRSQVDLEAPTQTELIELRGKGALATLNAGDTLFIPHNWWHHIHASQGSESERLSISLNMWFNPFQEFTATTIKPWPPIWAHVHAHIARAVEALVTSRSGKAADAFAEMIGLLDGTRVDGEGNAKEEKRRMMRNYVMHRLVGTYGRSGAAAFCRTFLHPSRWSEVRRVCFIG